MSKVVTTTYNTQWSLVSILNEDIWYIIRYTTLVRELKSHKYYHDQGSSIYEMPPYLEFFYTNRQWYMSHHVNRGVEVEHDETSSYYWSLMYTVNRHEITH